MHISDRFFLLLIRTAALSLITITKIFSRYYIHVTPSHLTYHTHRLNVITHIGVEML